jgi:type II secretory pathway pseudopilin PulG
VVTAQQHSRSHKLLFEISIAAILLAILGALIAPHVVGASEEARGVALLADLQTVRSRLEVYKAQHRGQYPDRDFVLQMTAYSNADGETGDARSPDHPYGPYLPAIPPNPFTQSERVRVVNSPRTRFLPPMEDAGWWYNLATGEFRADLTDVHTIADGTTLNQL